MITECFFSDRPALLAALVAECIEALSSAINHRQQASFLVSGGSSPQPLYNALSKTPMDWQRVQIALVDERWVNPGEKGSNETFIVENLLQDKAAVAKLIGMKSPHESAEQGLQDCESRYQQLQQPFDFTLLGMGPDAHTASLFPNASGLANALELESPQLCAAIKAAPSEVTGTLTERMTLTLSGLLKSRQLHLLITGDEKLAAYKQALKANDPMQSPISAVLHQETVPVRVYWAP